MKRKDLKVGETYETRIGRERHHVTLVSLRNDITRPLYGTDDPEDFEVIVRRPGGMFPEIYRTARQLRRVKP